MKTEKQEFIGEKLKELRIKIGKKIKDVAIDLGCSQQYISQIEKNIQDVNRVMLKKFSKYYNISIDELLFGEKVQDKNDKESNIDRIEEYSIGKKQLTELIESNNSLAKSHMNISMSNKDLSSQIVKVNDFMLEILKQKI